MTKCLLSKKNTTNSKIYKMMIGGAVTAVLVMSGCVSKPQKDVSGRTAVVESLAVALEENFVFPKIGEAYADYLRSIPLQNMEGMAPKTFASTLTSGLQDIHKDAHLRIMPPSDETEPEQKNNTPSSPLPAASIEETKWLMPDLAYIRFNLFPSDAKTLQTLDAFIRDHANTKTLIIDIRGHRGGGLAEMDLMFSHMFPVQTDLAYMETRKAVDEAGGSPIKDGKTVKTIKSPEGVVRRKHIAVPDATPLMLDTDIYILTSGYTASAAEHLSMVMKRTKRGIVVGDHTRGGAHYGGTVDLANGYAAFVPVGRTFNPDTQKDWEGSGVAPDIQVSSEEALIKVLLNLGVNNKESLKIDRGLNYKSPARPK